MTAPGAAAGKAIAGAARPLAPAPPPNPKIQAVQFALDLAKIRATAAIAGERVTDVGMLTSDAEAIAAFIGKAPGVGSGS